MIKILMHGCNGKMGRMITEIAKQDQDVEIVAGVDKYTAVANEYPVFETISECDVDADAVIDFSNAGAVFEKIVDYSTKVPSIITGPYFHEARDAISVATTNITNGADLKKELKKAEDTVNFNMGQ